MDVDTPNILKRSSSAPLINEAASTAATSPTTSTAPRSTSFFNMFNNSLPRTRSNSISCSPLSAAVSIPTLQSTCNRRLTPRVNQLRAEECADVSNTREVAHEREVHTAMQMGQSYEDLGLANSPTRVPRFSPAVSPSSTRSQPKFTTRRSLSPIALRASSFSPISRPNVLIGKRRCDDSDTPFSKRMCTTDRLTPSTPGTPDSDSLECTFRPVSPRSIPMNESPNESHDIHENHKSPNPS
ncbi:uncharacterized protein LOC112051871 [Bicyclus anynana]|uniref:Uncharacterized protein LOC112051871 n=1 Tax=Bicyclus anynana TaxID=110368 RepID=A0A6J1NN52_BICAN|nr:uncharacterized protein LOC112051871 [Bicyclus anynana]